MTLLHIIPNTLLKSAKFTPYCWIRSDWQFLELASGSLPSKWNEYIFCRTCGLSRNFLPIFCYSALRSFVRKDLLNDANCDEDRLNHKRRYLIQNSVYLGIATDVLTGRINIQIAKKVDNRVKVLRQVGWIYWELPNDQITMRV